MFRQRVNSVAVGLLFIRQFKESFNFVLYPEEISWSIVLTICAPENLCYPSRDEYMWTELRFCKTRFDTTTHI